MSKTKKASTRKAVSRPKCVDIEIPLSTGLPFQSERFMLMAICDPGGGPFLWFGFRHPDVSDAGKYVLFTTKDDALYEAAKAIVAAYEWHASKYGGAR